MQTANIDSGYEARKKERKKFWTIYGVSLVAAVLLCFLIFSTLGKMYRQDGSKLSDFNQQHTLLLNKTDKIAEQASDLVEVEKTKRLNSDATVDEILKQRRRDFERSLEDLKADSSGSALALFKGDIKNFLATSTALNFYLQPEHAFDNDLTALPKPDTPTKKAEDKNLGLQFAQLKVAYDLLLAQNLELKHKQSQTTPRTDGTSSLQSRITDLENQLSACKSQAAEDLKTKDVAMRNKDRELEALRSQKPDPGGSASDVDKAKFLFQNIDAVVRKSQANRKSVFDALKASLIDIQRSYPDKAALNRRISDLDQLSRGVVF